MVCMYLHMYILDGQVSICYQISVQESYFEEMFMYVCRLFSYYTIHDTTPNNTIHLIWITTYFKPVKQNTKICNRGMRMVVVWC